MWQLGAMNLPTFVTACALAIAPASVQAQALTPTELAAVDKVVADGLAATATPSAQVAIVRGGKIVLVKAYGEQAKGVPAQTDAPYQIASISKQFSTLR